MIYPLLAYPNLFPVCPTNLMPDPLKGAILFAIKHRDIPPAIALTDAIAAAGAVVHCGYDCLTPEGETMPATINTCTVAPSATGKGQSIKLFFAHFLQAQKQRKPRFVESDENGKAIKMPRNPIVEAMMNKPSYRKLMEELDGQGMNLTIQREEGTSFLKTDLFKQNTDAITQVWSGDPPLDHFVYGAELIAADARCSLGFRIQPDLFYPYLKGSGALTYKLGFWPRAIAGCHDPDRFPWNETFLVYSTSGAHSDAYHRRVGQLAKEINDRNRSGFADRIEVGLDEEAKAFMLELSFRMKQWLPAYYTDIREAAGRAWENALRVAVVLHVFCVGKGNVSLDMVERAWAIVEWSLSQHRLIFVEAARSHTNPTRQRPVGQFKVPQSQRRLNTDMQFMLNVISARSPYSPKDRVPLSDVLLLTGFGKARFLKTLGWLVAGQYVLVEGVDEYMTVLLLPAKLPDSFV